MSKLSEWREAFDLEHLIKGLTLAAIALTGAGFLIVSITHAQYGFISTNPFRPRLISAGFLFTLFCSLPCVAAYLGSIYGGSGDVGKLDLFSIRLFGFLLWTTVAGMSTAIFLSSSEESSALHHSRGQEMMATNLLCMIMAVALRHKKPLWSRSIIWAGTAIELFLLVKVSVRISRLPTGEASLFFWVVSLSVLIFMLFMTVQLTEVPDKSPPFPYVMMSLTLITLPLTLIAMFAQLVYPNISTRWGGGHPSRIVLSFKRDSAFGPIKLDKLLVDETDAGFYVVDAKHAQAHFVPRDQVALIDYEGE